MHCVGVQRGGPHRSAVGVGLLRLSYPRLVCVLFSGPSLLEMKFFQKLFPPSFCSFWGGGGGGVLNQFSNTTRFTSKHDITLQTNASSLATRELPLFTSEHNVTLHTNAFIASNEIASAIHLRIQHHTADKRVYSWRRTRFVLETNTFGAGDKLVENAHSNFSHTHTASYERLPNRTYVEMIAATYLQKEALSRCGAPKGIWIHNRIFHGNKLVFKTK